MDPEVKTQEVRRPAWAGQFYPASPTELARDIARMFEQAPKPSISGDIVAVVAPHAGYTYSGQVAANTYKLLEGHEYETVIIISPSHTKYFGGVSIYNGGSYETPLGSIPTDIPMAKRLARMAPGTIYLSNMGHTGGMRSEHALEVQLPFLQIALGSFHLVAMVMGEQQAWRALGDALASVAQAGDVLLVASSDLSHYHPAASAERLDGAVRSAMADFDVSSLSGVFESGRGEACGAGPILASMHAARKVGCRQAVITGYSHSGLVTGDLEGVVGYLGAAFLRSEPEPRVYELNTHDAPSLSLSPDDRQELLRLARLAVASAVYQSAPPDTSRATRTLRRRCGAFVTLKIDGELRGCIGSIESALPLVETVVKMAAAASARDPRFPPVEPSELSRLDVEVSVLGPIERCEDTELIEIGRHGLVIRKGDRSGVLLPQVAAEHGWDRLTYLRQVCQKAGLAAEAWRDSATVLYTFEAEVI